VKKICDSAFCGCAGLSDVELGAVEEIRNEAFKHCTSLSRIAFPGSVSGLGTGCLAGCRGLSELSFGPDSQVTKFEEKTLSGCTSLKSVVIPPLLRELPKGLLASSSRSLEAVFFGEGASLLRIEESTFAGFCRLRAICIPAAVQVIAARSFSGCTALCEITFESGSQLLKIGECAFQNCTALASIVVPACVCDLGKEWIGTCAQIELEAGSALVASGGELDLGVLPKDCIVIVHCGEDFRIKGCVLQSRNDGQSRFLVQTA
jgi:hypothetical protein